MNLWSPLVPFPDTFGGRLLGTHHPNIPGLNQWEGGCYLGAGLLLLAVFAIPSLRGAPAALRRHAVLATLLLMTLVFAISHRVGFGSHELFSVPLPTRAVEFLSAFRGSGRFVWLSVYVFIAAVIVAVVRRYSVRVSASLLAIAAVVQIIDVAPMQASVRAASERGAESTINRSAWEKLIGDHARVFVFPSFQCGSLFGNGVPGTKWRELEIAWIATQQSKPTNSAYLARYTKDCERERAQARADIRTPGTHYLYRSTDDVGAALTGAGAVTARCGYLDDVVICSAQQDLSAFR